MKGRGINKKNESRLILYLEKVKKETDQKLKKDNASNSRDIQNSKPNR